MGNNSGARHCSICGGAGHDHRTCTVPTTAGQCSVCGARGHDKRNCPVERSTPR